MLKKAYCLNLLEHVEFIQTWKAAYPYSACRELVLKTRRIQNESKKQIEGENN